MGREEKRKGGGGRGGEEDKGEGGKNMGLETQRGINDEGTFLEEIKEKK